MAGFPMLAVELTTKTSTLYFSTTPYTSRSGDSPSRTTFDPRLLNDVTFSREVGCIFWGERSRGKQSYGAIEINNADGALDSLVGQSLRDLPLVIRRGDAGAAYSTFSVVATLVIDQLDFTDESVLRVVVKDTSAKLERTLQQSLYPATLPNISLRGRPRPISIGRCYQVPLLQPDMTGNGRYDVHEDDSWIGIEQLLDQGSTPVQGTGYQRSSAAGIFGLERLNAIQGKQVATVLGRFAIATTWMNDDFTSLANWTEANGGVAGRDASIVSNECRLQNTLGGADLSITNTTSVSVTGTAATEYFYYSFDCTQWTSGSAVFRSSALAVNDRVIAGVGRYTGIIRSTSAWAPRFIALAGSNCDLRIDNFVVRRVVPAERLPDVLSYLCTVKGPLVFGDLDTTDINALDASAPYALGFYTNEPVSIADVLDQVMDSFGGWWYVDRLGKLTVGRLAAPIGSPAFVFNSTNIASGMRIEFDAAKGLSNVVLAKRNFEPYGESEILPALNTLSLNASDKDADVALSNNNYSYVASNAGSVRDVPALFGDRYYFEVQATAIDGAQQHYVGVANASAGIGSVAGNDNNSIGYRANGQSYYGGALSAYGTAWAANDYIGIAIDARTAASGCTRAHFRVYFRRNGTWQASSDPATEAGYLQVAAGSTGFAYLMVGANALATNGGVVNFGQSTFQYAPPDDYLAPAWHRQTIVATFRYRYRSSTALAGAYVYADSTGPDDEPGIPTLLTREADARAECDRWATLYSSERFFYTFDALLDSGVDADQIEPGDLIQVSYPRFGLNAKLLRVVAVKGRMLDRTVNIMAWG